MPSPHFGPVRLSTVLHDESHAVQVPLTVYGHCVSVTVLPSSPSTWVQSGSHEAVSPPVSQTSLRTGFTNESPHSAGVQSESQVMVLPPWSQISPRTALTCMSPQNGTVQSESQVIESTPM